MKRSWEVKSVENTSSDLVGSFRNALICPSSFSVLSSVVSFCPVPTSGLSRCDLLFEYFSDPVSILVDFSCLFFLGVFGLLLSLFCLESFLSDLSSLDTLAVILLAKKECS